MLSNTYKIVSFFYRGRVSRRYYPAVATISCELFLNHFTSSATTKALIVCTHTRSIEINYSKLLSPTVFLILVFSEHVFLSLLIVLMKW
ncbi:hypothetical protein BGX38DRAFT_1202438 [Terfezia claveryi]|nr:hypothetical protein BGX38DRAFT_1202438 [Terfezia claveryi]